MSHTRRPAYVAALVTAAALLVSGCSEDVPTRASTLDDPAGTSGAEPEEDRQDGSVGAEQNNDLAVAGEPLSKAEAKDVLPPVSVLPAGWSVDPDNTLTSEEGEDESDDVVTPKRCAVVFETLDELDKAEPVVEQGVTYTAGALGPFLGVEVSSFEGEVNDEQFSAVLKGLSECPKFTVDDGESVSQFTATALSFPNYGEESLALRMTGTADAFAFGMDYVGIRVGHNLVAVTQMGIGGPAPIKPLKKAAQVTMRNLTEH